MPVKDLGNRGGLRLRSRFRFRTDALPQPPPRRGRGKGEGPIGNRLSLPAWFVLACALVLAGCVCSKPSAEPQAAVRSAASEKWTRTELYFGLSEPGAQVSAEEWRAFLDSFVTPRFPEGLTVCDVHGQWRDGKGVVQKEPAKLLILIHEGSAAQERAIEELRAEYKKRFQQESVLRVDVPVRAAF